MIVQSLTNDDPNTVLSILDLPNLEAVDQRYEMKLTSWNKSIVFRDSGSPMTCWKDGHVFLQGVASSGHIKEQLTNFGQHKINVTVFKDVRFVNVIFFLASNWIFKDVRFVNVISFLASNWIISKLGSISRAASFRAIKMQQFLFEKWHSFELKAGQASTMVAQLLLLLGIILLNQLIGYHGEPLFAYNRWSNEYHLLGLSSGAMEQAEKQRSTGLKILLGPVPGSNNLPGPGPDPGLLRMIVEKCKWGIADFKMSYSQEDTSTITLVILRAIV
uniref:Uncharacterized protein n=1 Tax=Romanomermis culicivorax TaxID=13658 RepID=A0A915HIU1_ROMCU